MKKTALLFAVVLLVWAVNASKDKKEGRKKRGLFDHIKNVLTKLKELAGHVKNATSEIKNEWKEYQESKMDRESKPRMGPLAESLEDLRDLHWEDDDYMPIAGAPDDLAWYPRYINVRDPDFFG